LLAAGKCSVRNPSHVFYLPDTDGREQDEAFYLKISVDCEGTGNIYFTHEGLVILQMKNGSTEWRPLSFFATRIWDHAPPDWFLGEEPVEQKVFGCRAPAIAALMRTTCVNSSKCGTQATTQVLVSMRNGLPLTWTC
jgi:hypothetical protein